MTVTSRAVLLGYYVFICAHTVFNCTNIRCVYTTRCDVAHLSSPSLEIELSSLCFVDDPSFIYKRHLDFFFCQTAAAGGEWETCLRCCSVAVTESRCLLWMCDFFSILHLSEAETLLSSLTFIPHEDLLSACSKKIALHSKSLRIFSFHVSWSCSD